MVLLTATTPSRGSLRKPQSGTTQTEITGSLGAYWVENKLQLKYLGTLFSLIIFHFVAKGYIYAGFTTLYRVWKRG